MKNEKIRKLVREVLSEIDMSSNGSGMGSNNEVSRFHGYPSGYGQFPFLHVDTPDNLPSVEDIRKGNDATFNKIQGNNDVYEFPIEMFQLGLEKEISDEKERKGFIDLFDMARLVLDNLEKNKDYYYNEQNAEQNAENEDKRDIEHIENGAAGD